MLKKELNILKIMKEKKCSWEEAFKKENEKRTLKEFFNN